MKSTQDCLIGLPFTVAAGSAAWAVEFNANAEIVNNVKRIWLIFIRNP